ncbi:DUF2225 domain-containing protein [Metabacillus lacus]|uniref:DUF2225 domain-containing protein n=1 Tax=Metabacillus lacus TaxID=1983721 RepID=UPI0014782E01
MNASEYLYDKQLNCPVCMKFFQTKKVRSSKIRILSHDTDFCSHYLDNDCNPLFYYVNVCPSCGYAYSDHSQLTLTSAAKAAIHNHISSKWNGSDYGIIRSKLQAIQAYKLGILSASLSNELHIIKAGMFLRLAWLYRTLFDNGAEEEKRFMSAALQEYIQSYMNLDFETAGYSETRLLYLIGELSRRTGNKQQATIYFSRIIQNQSSIKEKRLILMAKERWQDVRNGLIGGEALTSAEDSVDIHR